jgi:hypothetical protein
VPEADSWPSEAQAKIGATWVQSGVNKTGTYDGSDRWTAPSAGDLRLGTQLKNNSTVLNLTGTLVAPSLANTKTGVSGDGGTGTYDGSDRWTAIAESKVENGYAYKSNSVTDNMTGSLATGVTNIMQNQVLEPGSFEAVLERVS